MNSPVRRIYYADANTFIKLFNYYPETIFRSLWWNLDELVSASRLRTIQEVVHDVRDARFDNWVEARRAMVDDIGKDQAATDCLTEIMADLPHFVDHSKTTDEADQPLVAVALTRNRQTSTDRSLWNHVVLTEEGRRKPGKTRLRIPDACAHYGVECVALLGMMELEGWTF